MTKAKNCIIIAIVLYLAVTTTINRFINPSKSETDLFLDIPKSLILNFK